MSIQIPPSLRAIIDAGSPGELAELAELAASDAQVRIEIDGRVVTLSAETRMALRRVIEHMQRGDDLRRQIDPESLQVRLEPIVDLNTGHPVGFEALTSFGEREAIAGAWFKEAAQLGVSQEIELAAVEKALAKLPEIAKEHYLSVNVSPRSALSAGLSQMLRHIDAERIVLELTEHAEVDDYAELNAALAVYRGRGIRLAVDDAGAGFASLHHILLMKPEIVKLDISLVRDVDTDLARRALVSGLIFFAKQIEAVTVAEGVESPAQAEALRSLGVRHGQGWHFDPEPRATKKL